MNLFFKISTLCIASFAICDAGPLSIAQLSNNNTSFNISLAADTENNAIAVYNQNSQIFGTYSENQQLWTPPVMISNGLDFKGKPIAAMDASGTGLAVWLSSDLFFFDSIEANFFNGTTWGTAIVLDSGVGSPNVAMNGLGQGIAVWTSQPNLFSSFFNGGTWGPIVPAGTNAGGFLQVAYSPSGNAALVWSHFDLGINDIWANNYNGTTWIGQTLLDSTGNLFPDVGIDALGNAIAVWGGNGTSDIKASRYNGVSWSAGQTISTIGNNSPPIISVDSTGAAIAAWRESTNNVVYAVFNGISWSSPINAGAVASDISLTMDSAGNALLGISQDTTGSIFTIFIPKGQTAQLPLLIDENTEENRDISVALSTQSPLGFIGWVTSPGEGPGNAFATFLARPIPPEAAGRTCVSNFGMQKDRVHIITFAPSTDTTVVSYIIRRDGAIVDIIPPSGPFVFFDHNRCRGIPNTYTIVSVNANGIESNPVTIVL